LIVRFDPVIGGGSSMGSELGKTQTRREESPPRPESRGRILVVDDEGGVRRSIVRLLGRRHEVVAAASGAEAQEILGTDRAFDLLLFDLMMPGLTGMELHAWLAAQSPALAKRVVFLTGGAFTPSASEYLGRAGNLRLEKPFDTARFQTLVVELVDGARREGE
jgi:CheY-like chemotaxis protein